MKNALIDTLKETVEKLLMVYESQLQVMEFLKDDPRILDRSIMKAALDAFKKYHAFLPELVSRYAILKMETQSPQHARDLETLKQNLDQLLLMDKQVTFLMENLQEHAEDQVWTAADLGVMERIFEHLNERTGFDGDPKEMIEGMLALKKTTHPQETTVERANFSEQDSRNQVAYLKIHQLIQDLILEKIHPKQIQGALFTQYIHMMSLLVSSNPEAYFHQQVANAGELMIGLIQKLNLIEKTLEDDGPSEHMKEVAAKVTLLREAVKERMRRPLTQQEQKKHGDRLAKAFFHLLDDIGDASAPFLASIFLYNWVRLSTLESDVNEDYFQKLERNWDIVFDVIYNDELLKES